jgi:hypothetical protein
MTLGDIFNTQGLKKRKYTMKANIDSVRGKLYCDDGSGGGLVLATAALAVANKVVMAYEDHDYSEASEHEVDCVEQGYVEAAKVSGSGAAAQGNKIMLSATAGEVTKFTAGDAPAGGASTYYTTTIEDGVQAAIDKNAGPVGYAVAASLDADTTQKMWLGP